MLTINLRCTARISESVGCGSLACLLSLALLAMLWFPSSDDCVEDCISVSSSEGGTTRVGAMLDCSLLDCIED